MKKFLTIILIGFSNLTFGQTNPNADTTPPRTEPAAAGSESSTTPPSPPNDDDEITASLSALLSYNFINDNNSLQNLIPEVFYGWEKKTVLDKKKKWEKPVQWAAKVGPYAASQIAIKDSSTYIPALMMQGNAGLMINNYFMFDLDKNPNEDKRAQIIFSPCNFGLKLMGNFQDSSKTIIQHNIRPSITFKYQDLLMLTAQYTWAWHNLTTQSKDTYQEVFQRGYTDIDYLTVTLQCKISGKNADNPVYLMGVWRNLSKVYRFEDYNNFAVLSFGIRTNFDFTAGTQVAKTMPLY